MVRRKKKIDLSELDPLDTGDDSPMLYDVDIDSPYLSLGPGKKRKSKRG